MKFGPVPVSQAQGTILAHALRLPERRLKKGTLLTAEQVAAIQDSDFTEITVATLEAQDILEDVAAQRVGDAMLEGAAQSVPITAAKPFTGRVNLHAASAGLFTVDAAAINAINHIDRSITVATLPDNTFVEQGRMVATVKIIPFAVSGTSVQAVEDVALAHAAFGLAAARSFRVALVATCLPSLKASVMDKTVRVLEDRFEMLGSVLIGEQRVEHTADAVAGALRTLPDPADMVVVFGASAITDDADVIPEGLRMAGGEVGCVGMPVDPGNLLMTGTLAGIPVIGAPGCARSPAENGFDWVLQRLVCGLAVDEDYLSGLGVGGLLMEITSRPQPREG